MRLPLASAAALIAFGALLGSTAIPAFAQDQAQQNAPSKPETSTNPTARPQAPDENKKHSGTNNQAGPSAAQPTTDSNSQGEQSTHSVSGRQGKEEPGSHIPTQNLAVFVDGKLNVPGAPADSQTVPAKFSPRNDAIDKLPIMGMSLGLSDAQKRTIVESVRAADKPVANTQAKISEELPLALVVHDLPASANDPDMAKLKYVRAQNRVLLIEPTNRVVIGEIAN